MIYMYWQTTHWVGKQGDLTGVWHGRLSEERRKREEGREGNRRTRMQKG